MENPNNFLERTAKLGLASDALSQNEEVTTPISVGSLEELQELLAPAASAGKAAAPQARGRGMAPDMSEKNLLSRVQASMFNRLPFHGADAERLQHVFPLQVNSVAAENKTITGVWDLGTSQGTQVVNLGTLTMEANSYIIIRNTALVFTVDKLIRRGSPPSGYSDFNILGAPGRNGNNGNTGGQGGQGQDGSQGTCSSPGVAGNAGGSGNQGATGATGDYGGDGADGLASMPASITITSSIDSQTKNISVTTSSGAGGNGATCACEGTNGGNGGPGGTGGNGGPGGNGGNATNPVGEVVVTVPFDFPTNQVTAISSPVGPGSGGNGGTGGPGGDGGGGGGGGKHQSGGNGGGQGGSGNGGAHGRNGAASANGALITVKQG